MAIALFYALGTAVGGLLAPLLFGALIATGRRSALFGGYVLGSVLLGCASLTAAVWGVAAEGQSLEALAGGPAESARAQ